MLPAAIIFLALGPVVLYVTGRIRMKVHARRERRDGIAGTQDIAMWGTLVLFLLLVAASTCFILALRRGELPIRS